MADTRSAAQKRRDKKQYELKSLALPKETVFDKAGKGIGSAWSALKKYADPKKDVAAKYNEGLRKRQQKRGK